MDYQFPVIKNIRSVLPHVQGWDGINVVEKDGYTIIDYSVDIPEQFSRDHDGWEIRRECRGMIFDAATGIILRRPIHKFFNLNQKEETLFQNVKDKKITQILAKEDGSMLSPYVFGNRPVYGTRRGHETDVAAQASYELPLLSYNKGFWEANKRNITLGFEYVSPNNKIVLLYEQPKLVLIYARDLFTGQYYDIYDTFFDEFERVQRHKNISLENLAEAIRTSVGIEGVVVEYAGGHRLKIKGEEYVFLHKSKEKVSVESDVWKEILEGNIDDLIPFLDAGDVEKVRGIEKELWRLVQGYADFLDAEATALIEKHDGNVKSIGLDMSIAPAEKSFAFLKIKGTTALDHVKKLALESCTRNIRQETFKKRMQSVVGV